MTNVLTAIPARARFWLYVAYSLAGVAIGSVDVGFESAGVADPVWFTVTQKVYAYLAIALGATAASNITPGSTPPPSIKDNPLRPDDNQYG